ncbi:MAG: RNA-dependent DNA polymerase, partial [Candidatus Vogelbacteria bacterium]|nr:RNA-dependent DNA polymerase [Candidatus Vogelbacteria bacterium]
MEHILFKKISSLENLFGAWREFQRDKMQKSDVLEFAEKAEHHLLKLHQELINNKYQHGQYIRFYVNDPK